MGAQEAHSIVRFATLVAAAAVLLSVPSAQGLVLPDASTGGLVILQSGEHGTHLVWTPAREADAVYHVYRQVQHQDERPVLLGQTERPYFHDAQVHPGALVVYIVVVFVDGAEVSRHSTNFKTSSGACVSTNYHGSISVSLRNCLS